jgi:uncharacterized ferritin-like protein (DUF455 family)
MLEVCACVLHMLLAAQRRTDLFKPAFHTRASSQLQTRRIYALYQIAADEARHFGLVDARLRELGSYYGAIPAHKTLWDHALSTKEDVFGRIAVVPLVQEARGLDAGTGTARTMT